MLTSNPLIIHNHSITQTKCTDITKQFNCQLTAEICKQSPLLQPFSFSSSSVHLRSQCRRHLQLQSVARLLPRSWPAD